MIALQAGDAVVRDAAFPPRVSEWRCASQPALRAAGFERRQCRHEKAPRDAGLSLPG
jgi:hypothetical protein